MTVEQDKIKLVLERCRAMLLERSQSYDGQYSSDMTNDFDEAVEVFDINNVINKLEEMYCGSKK